MPPPPEFGLGIAMPLAFKAAITADKASCPLAIASSTDSPSEMHSEKPGYEIKYPFFHWSKGANLKRVIIQVVHHSISIHQTNEFFDTQRF